MQMAFMSKGNVIVSVKIPMVKYYCYISKACPNQQILERVIQKINKISISIPLLLERGAKEESFLKRYNA
jgi:hypothetical protein